MHTMHNVRCSRPYQTSCWCRMWMGSSCCESTKDSGAFHVSWWRLAPPTKENIQTKLFITSPNHTIPCNHSNQSMPSTHLKDRWQVKKVDTVLPEVKGEDSLIRVQGALEKNSKNIKEWCSNGDQPHHTYYTGQHTTMCRKQVYQNTIPYRPHHTYPRQHTTILHHDWQTHIQPACSL